MVSVNLKTIISIAFLCVLIFFGASCNEIKNSNTECRYVIIGKKEYVNYILYHPLKYAFSVEDYKELPDRFPDAMISAEIIFNSEMSSPDQTVSTTVLGINIKKDPLVNEIRITQGEYPKSANDEIILNKKAADLLLVGLEDKVILVFTDYHGLLNTYEFLVKGFYECKLDYKIDAIMDLRGAGSLLEMGNKITNLIVYNIDESILRDTINKRKYDLAVYCIDK